MGRNVEPWVILCPAGFVSFFIGVLFFALGLPGSAIGIPYAYIGAVYYGIASVWLFWYGYSKGGQETAYPLSFPGWVVITLPTVVGVGMIALALAGWARYPTSNYTQRKVSYEIPHGNYAAVSYSKEPSRRVKLAEKELPLGSFLRASRKGILGVQRLYFWADVVDYDLNKPFICLRYTGIPNRGSFEDQVTLFFSDTIVKLPQEARDVKVGTGSRTGVLDVYYRGLERVDYAYPLRHTRQWP